MMSPMSAEASVVRGYIEWMVSVPWSKRSKVQHDIKRRRKVLDRGPLRAGGSEGRDPRVPGGTKARQKAQGAGPVPGRASWRRQNVIRRIDCEVNEPEVCSDGAGWCA